MTSRKLSYRVAVVLIILASAFTMAQSVERSEITGLFLPGPPMETGSIRHDIVQVLNSNLSQVRRGLECGAYESVSWTRSTMPEGANQLRLQLRAQIENRGWDYLVFEEHEGVELFGVVPNSGNELIYGAWTPLDTGVLALTWCYAVQY